MGQAESKVVKDARKSKKLQLASQNLAELPRACAGVLGLQEVWIQKNALTTLPAECAGWTSAKLIYANENDLVLRDEVRHWVEVEEVNLSANRRIERLPGEVDRWRCLKQLYLNELPLLQQLPAAACTSWANLKVLHVNNCDLEALPAEVRSFVNLSQVALNDNPRLTELPAGVEAWARVEKIFLNNCGLRHLPPEIRGMRMLEKFYVNQNALEAIADEVGELSSLQELYVTGNKIAQVPEPLGNVATLNKLYLNDNKLAQPPPLSLWRACKLEILHLGGNADLSRLVAAQHGDGHEHMAQLRELKFLHLENTGLEAFPFDVLPTFEGLRVFSVEGTPLAGAYADKVAQAQAGLVKQWKFAMED